MILTLTISPSPLIVLHVFIIGTTVLIIYTVQLVVLPLDLHILIFRVQRFILVHEGEVETIYKLIEII